ncbi:hypothetical protein CPB86DRAFT_791451 [Serendipita vermifera]|nr:hypothetical protein CPB86DRAFT_791451 [Serendipita vermifera]
MALRIFADSSPARSTRSKCMSSVHTVSRVASSSKIAHSSSQPKSRTEPNNEKENINPLTGLDPLQSSKAAKSKAVFGASSKANATKTSEASTSKLTINVSNGIRPVTRSQTSPIRADTPNAQPSEVVKRKSRKSTTKATTTTAAAVASTSKIVKTQSIESSTSLLQSAIDALAPKSSKKDDETMTGKLLAARRQESSADRKAIELTVRPLADLSEAFNLSAESILPSEIELPLSELPHEEDDEPKELNHELEVSELAAALHRLASASDASVRLPTVLQKRGVKRSLDATRTSSEISLATSRRTSISTAATSRPTKRLRKTAVPVAPPNSPARSKSCPLPSDSDNIPPAKPEESDPEDDWTQEVSQGSSHFSSIIGSFTSARGRASLDSHDFSFTSQSL